MAEVQTLSYFNDTTNTYFLGDNQVALNTLSEPSSIDSDAQAFITATGISGTEATAINTLVIALKAGGFWTTQNAIYPMVGGTSTSCKYNLKNPANTDAAFRLSFVGGWTFSSSGAKPDGVSGTYADTFFQPATYLTTSNGSFSYYSFTNSASANSVEIGCTGATASSEINLATKFSDGNFYVFYANGGSGIANAVSNGFYINNKATNTEGWKNGSRLTNAGASTNMPTRNCYLGAENDGTTGYRNSARGCSYASMGGTLSDPAAYSTIVNNFQTTLGRNQY